MEAIAESTKIRRSLLVALENGDVSKLPRGIFRRGFLRAYADAIGIRPEPLLTELSRLSREPGSTFDPSLAGPAPGGMRLTLEPESRRAATVLLRVLAAAGDTGAVLLIAAAIARLTGANPWITTGAVGLGYYALGTACLGRSLASWWLARGSHAHDNEQPGSGHRRRAFLMPHWLNDLVRRSAAPVAGDTEVSQIDPSAEHASAHSHAARP